MPDSCWNCFWMLAMTLLASMLPDVACMDLSTRGGDENTKDNDMEVSILKSMQQMEQQMERNMAMLYNQAKEEMLSRERSMVENLSQKMQSIDANMEEIQKKQSIEGNMLAQQSQRLGSMKQEINMAGKDLRGIPGILLEGSLPTPTALSNGILTMLQDQNDLADSCRKKVSPWAARFVPQTQPRPNASAVHLYTHAMPMQTAWKRCKDDEVRLFRFANKDYETACCSSSMFEGCAGCAKYNTVSGSCEQPRGGFVLRGETSVACTDSVGWLTSKGLPCASLTASGCNDHKVDGETSNQACCLCGKRVSAPTPFSYSRKTWLIDEEIVLVPLPRTARRYTINRDCPLAENGLTMSGITGIISYLHVTQKPQQELNFECLVTAHQTDHVRTTAMVSVRTRRMSFGHDVVTIKSLLWATTGLPGNTGSTQERCEHGNSLKNGYEYLYNEGRSGDRPGACGLGGTWCCRRASNGISQRLILTTSEAGQNKSDFKLSCVPDASSWLSMEPSDGELIAGTQVMQGGLSEVNGFDSPNSAQCVVQANFSEGNSSVLRFSSFIVLSAQPWMAFFYDFETITVDVGQHFPTLVPKPAKASTSGQQLLQPGSFVVSCDKGYKVNCAKSDMSCGFSFDESSGIGLFKAYAIFDIDVHGYLTVSPSTDFSFVFDDITSTQEQASLTLTCKVVGIFPEETEAAPVSAPISITVRDNICWTRRSILGLEDMQSPLSGSGSCRQKCRSDPACSFYTESGCKKYILAKASPQGQQLTVFAKIPNCTAQTTCVFLNDGRYNFAGRYCPIGVDQEAGRSVYKKGVVAGGQAYYLFEDQNKWVAQEAHEQDLVIPQKGVFQFHGTKTNFGIAQITLRAEPCVTPRPLAAVSSETLPIFVVDDPTTSNSEQAEDHWLHPCDCVPKAWGATYPVNPESFEEIPPGSENDFIPSPYLLLRGQFACPLGETSEITYLDEDTKGGSDGDIACQLKCHETAHCNFYWQGSQHSTTACRLFAQCSHLVREAGIEGSIFAFPRTRLCRIADDQSCWATSLRRDFLAGSTAPFDGFASLQLHRNCDLLLLLGGIGVETCSRPAFRSTGSHDWQKRPLLRSDLHEHGTQFKVSCWSERYAGADMHIVCVSGLWKKDAASDDNGNPELSVASALLKGFDCRPLLLVTPSGYIDLQVQEKQELLYLDSLKLEIGSDVSGTDSKLNHHCLEVSDADNSRLTLKLTSAAQCTTTYLSEAASVASSDTRIFEVQATSPRCLMDKLDANAKDKGLETAVCNSTSEEQLWNPAAVPQRLELLHEWELVPASQRQATFKLVDSGECCTLHEAPHFLSSTDENYAKTAWHCGLWCSVLPGCSSFVWDTALHRCVACKRTCNPRDLVKSDGKGLSFNFQSGTSLLAGSSSTSLAEQNVHPITSGNTIAGPVASLHQELAVEEPDDMSVESLEHSPRAGEEPTHDSDPDGEEPEHMLVESWEHAPLAGEEPPPDSDPDGGTAGHNAVQEGRTLGVQETGDQRGQDDSDPEGETRIQNESSDRQHWFFSDDDGLGTDAASDIDGASYTHLPSTKTTERVSVSADALFERTADKAVIRSQRARTEELGEWRRRRRSAECYGRRRGESPSAVCVNRHRANGWSVEFTESSPYSEHQHKPIVGYATSDGNAWRNRVQFNSGYHTEGAGYTWSAEFSEKGSAMAECADNRVITQVKCGGKKCGNKRLRCELIKYGTLDNGDLDFSKWFLQEAHSCQAGFLMYRIQCQGSHCHYARFGCKRFKGCASGHYWAHNRCTVCSGGYVGKSGIFRTSCHNCQNGRFQPGRRDDCVAFQSCVDGQEYASFGGDRTRQRDCSPCTRCDSNHWTSRKCTTTSNTYCSRCSTVRRGHYQTQACWSGSPSQIGRNLLDTVCSTCTGDKYQSRPCGATTNTICTPCTRCQAGVQWQQTNCRQGGAHQPRVCQPCSTISVLGGTCTKCSSGTTCTEATCDDIANEWRPSLSQCRRKLGDLLTEVKVDSSTFSLSIPARSLVKCRGNTAFHRLAFSQVLTEDDWQISACGFAPWLPQISADSLQYHGCYKNRQPRLDGHIRGKNPSQCLELARQQNQIFLGLENNNDCLPLDSMPVFLLRAEDDECGDVDSATGYRLGRADRLAVYSLPSSTLEQSVPISRAELPSSWDHASPWNAWQESITKGLADCPLGTAMIGFGYSGAENGFVAYCQAVIGLGGCVEGYGDQFEARHASSDYSKWASDVSRHVVECGPTHRLKKFHFEASAGGEWMRVRFTCCHVSGAPVFITPRDRTNGASAETKRTATLVFDGKIPRTVKGVSAVISRNSKLKAAASDEALAAGCLTRCQASNFKVFTLKFSRPNEGQCRCFTESVETLVGNTMDGAGFRTYVIGDAWNKHSYSVLQQKTLTSWGPSSGQGDFLEFNAHLGRWCLKGDCTDIGSQLSPAGLRGTSFDVVKITDFDGNFIGKGVPKIPVPPPVSVPTFPPPTNAPTISQPGIPNFTDSYIRKNPKYEHSCLNFAPKGSGKSVWQSISETIGFDDEQKIVSPLDPDPNSKPNIDALDAYHPCKVAADQGGTLGGAFGERKDSNGETIDTSMDKAAKPITYDEWNVCMQGDINRGRNAEASEIGASNDEAFTEHIQEIAEHLCSPVPEGQIAPWGLGIASDFPRICEAITGVPGEIYEFAKKRVHTAVQDSYSDDDWNACNPIQVGMSRLFCDIFCTRDAVVRGDRAILENLEKATSVTQSNLQHVQRSIKSQSGWVAGRVDWSNKNLGLKLDHMLQTLSGKTTDVESKLNHLISLHGSGSSTSEPGMLAEIVGMARDASADPQSKANALTALAGFNEHSKPLRKSWNASEVVPFLLGVDGLYRTLARAHKARDRAQRLGGQFGKQVLSVHLNLQQQTHKLGVYHYMHKAFNQQSQKGERHESLLALDHLWWKLREALDRYMDGAQEEIGAFQTSLDVLSSYERCTAGRADLAGAYTRSMITMKRHHALLKETWNKGTNLFGELAAVITDGEVLTGFVREEGCSSSLLEQTGAQISIAISSIMMLSGRFKAAGMPAPDMSAMKDSVKSIAAARTEALQDCAAIGKPIS